MDLFFVRFCAREGQLYIYSECLWDHLFVPQAPAVCQICVQQISAGVCPLNCVAAKVLFWVFVLVCLPFLLMTVLSKERPASFSACFLLCCPPSLLASSACLLPRLPPLWICSLSGFVPKSTTLYLFGMPLGPLVCPLGSCDLPDLCSADICRLPCGRC